MRLVDDDGELAPAMLVTDLVQDERKLLYRGDDDLLARRQESPEIPRAIRMSDRGRYLRELFDGVPDLLVQHLPVSDDDDGIEDRSPVSGEFDQLMCHPRD